jgi:signal transduction histidine kinase
MAERSHAIEAQPQRGGHLRTVEAAWYDGPASRREARGRRVARDLVELSRLEHGYEQAQRTPVDLARLLRSVCADYPKLRVAGPDQLPLRTDPRRLARVLSVLLDNACLHGAPPVSVRYDADAIQISDGGPGLDPRLLARATEPFVTGARARGRGVGLGLAIAARQATLLGAELRLRNAEGGGAIAELHFAAVDSSSP